MFPARSDFQSGAGGAAWWTLKDSRGDVIGQSQWPTLVKAFQKFASENIPELFSFLDTGDCAQGSLLADIGAVFRANVRQRSSLQQDGQWGPETADALGWFLCKTGQTTMTQLLVSSAATKGQIPADIVREVILFGQYVVPSDLAAPGVNASLPEYKAAIGSSITLAADTLLPKWSTNPGVDTRDADWVGGSLWGDPLPNPPSKTPPAVRPWAPLADTPPSPPVSPPAPPPVTPPAAPPPVTPAAGGVGGTDLAVLAVAAGAWLFSRQGRRSSPGTRRRVRRAISRVATGRKRRKRKSTTKKAATKKPAAKKTATKRKTTRRPRKSAGKSKGDTSSYTQKEKGAASYGQSVAALGHPLREERLKAHRYGKHEQGIARYWHAKERARIDAKRKG